MEVIFCPLNWILYVWDACIKVFVFASLWQDLWMQNSGSGRIHGYQTPEPKSARPRIFWPSAPRIWCEDNCHAGLWGQEEEGEGAAQLFYLIWASGFGSSGLSGPRIHFSWRVWYCIQSVFCWAKLKSPLTPLDPYDHLYYITNDQNQNCNIDSRAKDNHDHHHDHDHNHHTQS